LILHTIFYRTLTRTDCAGLAVLLAEGTLHIALIFPAFQIFTLVVEPFPLANTDFDLGLAFCEVDLQRHEGEPSFPGFGVDLADLLLMQEELPGPKRFMVVAVAVRIGTDVHLVEKDLALLDGGVAVLEVRPALTEGLDFRTDKDHPGLVGILYEKVAPGLLVLADDLLGGVLFYLFCHLVHLVRDAHIFTRHFRIAIL